MDPALSFYQSLSSISFTLLGLWFTVLGLSHGGWRSDPLLHRSTLHVALHFFLPGLMGLGSTLAAGNGLMWRITFGLLGTVGLVESLLFLRHRQGTAARTVRLLRAADPLLYALVVAVVFLPGPVAGTTPLQLEGVVTGLLFVAGLCYLWFAFAQRAPLPAPPAAPAPRAPASPAAPRAPERAAPPVV
ncbi:hypothetical protein ND486_11465 [Pseudonocardia sp. DR1-2]|uniref:hypothetical protein n=1 Tax=Pseudonocardia TaxID=1847 RepID=UPI002042D448|nr:hypothetical protein [Pseudonocardia sp. DR1-2]MCM3846808.1 hypothetical protein [Pseudonocardia sp. DR1-2]